MKIDSTLVEEVRGRAMKISERHGHDLHHYCKYLQRKQAKHPDRLVSQLTVVAIPTEKRRRLG